jgi:long-chain acyl-CoA synthetase
MTRTETHLSVAAISVQQVLERSYVTYADNVAVSDGERALTYAELRVRAMAVAAGLRSLGCEPGDRIVLIAPNTVEWVEVDHACYLGGFVRVGPLTRSHPRELEKVLKDADPSAVVADAAWLAGAGTDWIPDRITRLVTIRGTHRDATHSYQELIAAGSGIELPAPAPHGQVWIMYTSGSTGLPKGVLTTGDRVGAMIRNTVAEMPDLSQADVAIHTAPLSHFSGAIALAIFATGGANVLHPQFDMDRLAGALDRGAVSVLPLVPTQINMFVDELLRRRDAGESIHIDGLRRIVYAGSASAPNRLARAKAVFGDVLLQFYGTSESPLPLTALHPEDHDPAVIGGGGLPRMASAGRATRFVDVRIVDELGQLAAPWARGEIHVRGAQTMVGYWRQPDATTQVLSADGWLATGEVGYLDQDGYLFIIDRKKDMIVSGGFNVYPREVEKVISTMPQVRDVAVVGAPSEQWGEELTAVISLQPGAEHSDEMVIEGCRRAIAGYKVPKQVRFVTDLPLSAAGKIDRRSIRDQLWDGHIRSV